MSVPSADRILRTFDGLNHDARMRSLGLLARQYADSAEIDRLIAELEAGETYESYLAVRLAALCGRSEPLQRALVSGSAKVMRSAANYLPRVVSDAETLVNAYARCVPAVRPILIQQIVRRRRVEAAQALFPIILAEEGPGLAMTVVLVCPDEVVCRALAEYGHAVRNWKSLARFHPQVVLDLLRRQLEEASLAERAFIWSRYYSAVQPLSLEYPEEIARLGLDHGTVDGLPFALEEVLGLLARRVPDLAFELLTAEGNLRRLRQVGIPARMLDHVRSLSLDHRRKLAQILALMPDHLAALLDVHAPSERADLLKYARQEIDTARAPWSDALLRVLPHKARHGEARRILGLEEIRSNPMRTLQLTAYLPFEQARTIFETAARASDANERGAALAGLLRCAGLNRRGVEEALQFCQKIENDQDPVRLAVYAALADCPPTIFEDRHAPLLSRLLAYAFEARDTSWQTRSTLERLSIGLIQAWAVRPNSEVFSVALGVIEELARQSRYLRLDLQHRLPRRAETPLIAALEQPLRDSVAREDYTLLFLFARALGRRAWGSMLIQSLLKKATRAKPDGVADAAIALWLDDPETRDKRVEELLRRDRSCIRLRSVFLHVHRRRQDLLDPYLMKRPLLGRFLSGETIYVVPATGGFFRWLPRQQRLYGELLDEIIGDVGTSIWGRVSAMKIRARLPTTELEELEPWISSPDVNIAEAALHGLSRLDRPHRGISLLAEHLDSSRARVAVYSMFRSASYTSPTALHRLLGEILHRDRLKVTVEKEVVRLLSRFGSKENVDLLFSYVGESELHRDVKIAAGRAARNLLHQEQAWKIVEQLATDEDRYVVSSLLTESWATFSREDARRYLDIIVSVTTHDDRVARQAAVSALRWWARIDAEQVAEVSADQITSLDSGCWMQGLEALYQASLFGDTTERVVNVVHALRSVSLEEQSEAEVDRDLPARQRLAVLVDRFVGVERTWAEHHRLLLNELDKELSDDATLASLRIGLRLSTVRWESVDTALEDLRALLEIFDGTWIEVGEVSRRLALHLTARRNVDDEKVLRPLCVAMAHAPDPRLHRMAIGLLTVIGPRLCWPEELVDVLVQLRRDDDVAVRATALGVFVAAEN